jgi:hypothetical protein
MRRSAVTRALLLAATIAAALPACEGGTAVRRGFGSTQVVPLLRDPSFELWSSKGDLVFYRTGATGAPQTFWSIDVGTGEVRNIGPTMPTLVDPPPPARYQCDYAAGADGSSTTYQITDTQSGELTAVENVYATWPYCPRDDDPSLSVWRIDPDKTLSLWTGAYTYLVQATLPLVVHQVFARTTTGWMVSASSTAAPNGLGIYRFTDQDPSAVTEVLPAAMDGAGWADGAPTAAGAPLASSGLIDDSLFLPAGAGNYCYERAMSDGGVTMFAGPQPTGPRELALFPVDPAGQLRVGTVVPYSYRYDGVFTYTDVWTSLEGNPQAAMFRLWRPALGRLASCAWPGGDLYPNALADPASENVILLEQQTSYQLSPNSPFMLVVPGATDGNACKLMAPTAVGYADFSPDGTALAWLVEPPDGKATLWTAARDGSGARAIGTETIDGFNYGRTRAPHFVGGSQLELTLGGDLVWVDVHDDPPQVHDVTQQVFGGSIDLGRWVVSGHEFSEQDANGKLALINRDTGETREISPAVQQYISPDVPLYGTTPGVFDDDGSPVRIVYLVRGRNPSAQDGVWIATITAQDRQ